MSSWLDEIDCLGYTNAGVSSGMYAAQILKSIAGQSLFQLVVMYAAVFHADALFGVPNAGLADGRSHDEAAQRGGISGAGRCGQDLHTDTGGETLGQIYGLTAWLTDVPPSVRSPIWNMMR